MKQAAALLILFLFAISAQAQDRGCNATSPKNCSLNLLDTITNAIDSQMNIIYGRSTNPRFKDVEFPFNCGNTTGISCSTDTAVLLLSAYFPNINFSNTCKRPVVLFFHGGAFSDCGNYNDKQIKTFCRDYAYRGYIAIFFDYRRGTAVDTFITSIPYVCAQQIAAIYRAAQDVIGAVKSALYIETHHSSFTDIKFRIDTNYVFIGGVSAGSLASLLATYYTQNMIDQLLPGLHARLGSINANNYIGDTSIDYKHFIKGVLNHWSGLYVPPAYKNNPAPFFASLNNKPPIITFQGKADSTFPYIKQDIFFSPAMHTIFHSDNHCFDSGGVFTLNSNTSGLPDMEEIGSQTLYNILKSIHVPAEFYLDTNMAHGLDDDCDTCNFKSEFGTGDTSAEQVIWYMTGRDATFMQAIINNIAGKLNTTKFTECENYRHGCDTLDNNDSCTSGFLLLPQKHFLQLKNILYEAFFTNDIYADACLCFNKGKRAARYARS